MHPNKYIYKLKEILTVLKTIPQFKVVCSNKVKTNYNTELKYLFLNYLDLTKLAEILMNESKPPFKIEIKTDLDKAYVFNEKNKKLIVQTLEYSNSVPGWYGIC
ncbi:hypothetical protein [Candidatus Phytoplasma prunorum]|uniref:hypothetical protein n=1 Tax=Candidatus Phytoplasma prunorum TaxID=47565 RepID=UPI002FF3E144